MPKGVCVGVCMCVSMHPYMSASIHLLCLYVCERMHAGMGRVCASIHLIVSV